MVKLDKSYVIMTQQKSESDQALNPAWNQKSRFKFGVIVSSTILLYCAFVVMSRTISYCIFCQERLSPALMVMYKQCCIAMIPPVIVLR